MHMQYMHIYLVQWIDRQHDILRSPRQQCAECRDPLAPVVQTSPLHLDHLTGGREGGGREGGRKERGVGERRDDREGQSVEGGRGNGEDRGREGGRGGGKGSGRKEG